RASPRVTRDPLPATMSSAVWTASEVPPASTTIAMPIPCASSAPRAPAPLPAPHPRDVGPERPGQPQARLVPRPSEDDERRRAGGAEHLEVEEPQRAGADDGGRLARGRAEGVERVHR